MYAVHASPSTLSTMVEPAAHSVTLLAVHHAIGRITVRHVLLLMLPITASASSVIYQTVCHAPAKIIALPVQLITPWIPQEAPAPTARSLTVSCAGRQTFAILVLVA